jgi:hypothetical protein
MIDLRRSIAMLLAVILSAAALRAHADDQFVALVSGGTERCAISIPRSDALLARTATKLADYFQEQTGAKPSVLSDTELVDSEPHDVWIVLDGGDGWPTLSKLGVKPNVPDDRTDAYQLQVVPHGKHTIVSLAGRSAAGVKYAAYRFMEEMEIENHEARIRPLDLRASPFFKTRSISLFNIWRVPIDVIRQCNLEAWPKEKVQQNVDTYDAFGFNAIETHDRFHEDFLKAVYGITRAEWRDKVWAMCDRAHEDGMTVFFRQWGNSVALPIKKDTLKGGFTPFGFNNLAPDIPEEKKRWDTEIRDYTSKNYASHIDHLIGHWADAGGVHEGSKATVKDSMLLHNELVAAFRAINPKIESTFNLWGMANPRGHRGWPGYEDHRSICDAGVLPKDVMIAQTTRAHSHEYSEKVTADILKSGHPAAVWTWRRADTEVRFGDAGLRIRIHDVVGDYFHNLPDSARELSWHNIERNHHGIATDVNYYVVGKLLWDPKTDVDAAALKYCALVFGKENAPAVAEAFNVIEWSRDVEKQVSRRMLDHPAEGVSRAKAALEAVSKIKLPADHHSRLPSVTSPQEMLSEITGTLAVIAENGQIIAEQMPRLRKLIADKKTDEANALAATLQKKADAWFGTIAGGVEGLWLKEAIADKLNPTDSVKEWFGFKTFNVDALNQKDKTVRVSSDEGKTGIALLEMKTPAKRHAEFHFTFTPAPSGKSRNGGLVLAADRNASETIACQVMVGGGFLRIKGDVGETVQDELKGVDPSTPIDCTVSIDFDSRRVTFKAGESTIQAHLKQKTASAIGAYGYIVDKTTSEFSEIEVKSAE